MEQIGLRAVLQDADFRRGTSEYISSVGKMDSATARASGAMSGNMSMLSGVFSSVMKTIATSVAYGVAGLGAALVGVGVSGVKAAMDLEAQMSGVAAVLQLTTQEAQPLKQLVQDLAIDPLLKVSATEAAAAIEMLARNGLGMEEIMGGAARGTVLLANATGADFSQAADIATDAMAQFNISTEDFGGAVDGITSVVNNSKFTINDYALALAQGGGVAATAGVSFDDFNATIASISPLFASGSDAGTSFKNMLTRLANPTDEARSLMNELGLEFYDAEGNLKSMADISSQLNQAMHGTSEVMVEVGGRTAEQNAELARLDGRYKTTTQQIADYTAGILGAGMTESARAKKIADLVTQQQNIQASMEPLIGITGEYTTVTKQLTEEQRTAALATLFGSDSMRAAAGLAEAGTVMYTDAAAAAAELGVSHEDLAWALEGGITQYEALMISMGQTSAIESAATRVDNLAGDMDILSGVVEALKIQIGDALIPFLRRLVKAGTQLLLDFVQPAVDAFTKFFDNLKEGMSPLSAFIDALDGIAPQGVIDFLNNLQANILPALRDALDRFSAWFSENRETILSVLSAVAAGFAAFMVISTVVGWITSLVAAWGAVSAAVTAAGSIFSAIVAVLGGPITVVILAISALVALFAYAWSQNWGGIQEKTAVAIAFIKDVVLQGITLVKDWWSANGDAIMAKALEIWTTVKDHISTGLENAKIIISTALTTIQQWWSENGDTIIAKALEIWTAVKDHISTGIENAKLIISTALTTIQQWWSENGDNIIAKALEIWTAVKDHISTGIENAKLIISTALTTIQQWWSENGDKVIQTVEALWEGIKNAYKTATGFVLGIIASALAVIGGDWELAGEAWNSTVKVAWDSLKEAFSNGLTIIQNAVGDAWPAIKEHFSAGVNNLKTIITNVDWGAVGMEIINGIANALSNGIAIIQEAAAALAQAALEAARSVLRSKSPSKEFEEIGDDSVEGFVNGIEDGEKTITDKVQSVFDLSSKLGSIGSTIAGIFKTNELKPLEDGLKDIDQQMASIGEKDLAEAVGMSVEELRKLSPQMFTGIGGIGGFGAMSAEAEQYLALMQERIGLEEELAEKQEAVLALEKQQQDLALLKAQQDLLDLVQSNQLSSSVLEGLTLGLDANLGDILERTSLAMQELLTQSNASLLAGSIPARGGGNTGGKMPPVVLGLPNGYNEPSFGGGGGTTKQYNLNVNSQRSVDNIQSQFKLMEMVQG